MQLLIEDPSEVAPVSCEHLDGLEIVAVYKKVMSSKKLIFPIFTTPIDS